MSLSSTAWISPRWLATGVIASLVCMLVVLGHDGRRVAQMVVLMLPALVWMLWPVQRYHWRRIRLALVTTILLGFVLDGLARAYLQSRYGAAPNSAFVLAAVANTTPRETLEYLATVSVDVVVWLAVGMAAMIVIGTALCLGFREAVPLSRRTRRWLIVLLVICAVGYLIKPWRRLHPVLFWPAWVESVHALRANWSDQQTVRERKLAHAAALTPTVAVAGTSTVVLVLTDSVNRENMSAYGYARDTTPRLRSQPGLLGREWLALRHAWSTEPGTLASLASIFGFGEPEQGLHLVALARVAGYKVWWISNHDDVAIQQTHALMGDVVEFENRQPGRSGESLDAALLDDLEEALNHPAERKFIVVHMLGTHPHYGMRKPDGWDPFVGRDDEVDAALERQGRLFWVREMRRIYDEAMHYHDSVVADSLRLTREAGRSSTHRAWMYLSDHGQEIGHAANRAGHSGDTPAGYKIPAMLWRQAAEFSPDMADRPFRADWAAWTLADLLHLQWEGNEPRRNVLDVGYQWHAPQLPVPGLNFME